MAIIENVRINPVTGETYIEYSEVAEPTPEEIAAAAAAEELRIITELTDVVQRYLDDVAQGCRYDGILSLCTYHNDPDPTFAAEAAAGVQFRSDCWTYCRQVILDIRNGVRSVPTADELIAELPKIVWPA